MFLTFRLLWQTVLLGVLLTRHLPAAAAEDGGLRVPLNRRSKLRALQSAPRTFGKPWNSKPWSPNKFSGDCSNFHPSTPDTECAVFDPTDNGAYYGSITIDGEPSQTFNVTLDSGSSDLWILSTTGKKLVEYVWVPTASKTGTDTGLNSTIEYGDGSSASYEWWNETITFAGITARNVIAGAADLAQNNVTADELNYEGSGLLGVGWQALNTGGYLPFIQKAFSEGLIPKNLFGFYAGLEDNSTNGEITVGFIDSSRYTGELNYHAVEKLQGDYYFFNVNVSSVRIGDSTHDYSNGTSRSYIIDTGTSFLTLGTPLLNEVVKSVNATLISNSTVAGGYSIACETIKTAPDLTFVIDGIDYVIPGDVWTHYDPTLAEAGVPCFAELYDNGPYEGDGGVDGIFGDTFFRQFYTVFDFENYRTGFAKSINAK